MHCAILTSPFRDPGARFLDAHQLLGFYLPGWRRPHDQHDVVELIDHLLPRLQPQHAQHTWSARQRLEEGMRLHSRSELTKCLPLSSTSIDSPDVQKLIARWHQQDTWESHVSTRTQTPQEVLSRSASVAGEAIFASSSTCGVNPPRLTTLQWPAVSLGP